MVILIVIMFVIVVLKFFTGGPMMCDGGLCYRGVPAFVCMNAFCGSVIRLWLITIVLKRYNSVKAVPHITSWRPQNYGQSTPNEVEREKQRVILVACCQHRRKPQYRFYDPFLEHFFSDAAGVVVAEECLWNRAKSRE